MKKVLIVYFSRTGKTEKMAEYIAEGVRFSGNSAEIKKLSERKDKGHVNNG
ncbi:MAG: flavodoxin family protein [Candidatus Scalinduaceae bacterium]